ncbi:hypothetical protein PG987_015598 [Apiospora arundinis]
MADNDDTSAQTGKFEVTEREAKLLMVVLESCAPNFSIQGWDGIATKAGLSKATANLESLAALCSPERPLHKHHCRRRPAPPTILKRKRGPKRADSDDENDDGENPAAGTGPKRSRRSAATQQNPDTKDGSQAASASGSVSRGRRIAGSRRTMPDPEDDGDDVPSAGHGSGRPLLFPNLPARSSTVSAVEDDGEPEEELPGTNNEEDDQGSENEEGGPASG